MWTIESAQWKEKNWSSHSNIDYMYSSKSNFIENQMSEERQQ